SSYAAVRNLVNCFSDGRTIFGCKDLRRFRKSTTAQSMVEVALCAEEAMQLQDVGAVMNSDSEQELWGSGESISGDQTWSNPVSAQVTPDNNSRKGGCGCDIGVSAGASVEVLKVSRLVNLLLFAL
ncbi:hypothetical protein H671_1g3514, partial [Cricetulus griseus]